MADAIARLREDERAKKRGATISLLTNLGLTLIKFVAAALTGSMSLLSEAVHSATDVVASFIAFLSVRAAMRPPDEEHPYGHGKLESLAGLAESVFLLLIVVYIFVEAVQRILHGSEVENLDFGMAVVGASSLASFLVGRHITALGNRTGSIALRSNGQHLMVDFWTSVGVFAALLTSRLTGWQEADAVFAMLLGIFIAWGASKMALEAGHQLIDVRLPEEEVAIIRQILDEAQGCLSYHRLKTRHSGNVHYIEVHVVVPNTWTVVEAHDLVDSLEKKIAAELQPAHVVIHVDPFDDAKATRPA